ncbi:hypothetical protein RCL1_009063 [Eukaryota sp. TZLM3-RCL]
MAKHLSLTTSGKSKIVITESTSKLAMFSVSKALEVQLSATHFVVYLNFVSLFATQTTTVIHETRNLLGSVIIEGSSVSIFHTAHVQVSRQCLNVWRLFLKTSQVVSTISSTVNHNSIQYPYTAFDFPLDIQLYCHAFPHFHEDLYSGKVAPCFVVSSVSLSHFYTLPWYGLKLNGVTSVHSLDSSRELFIGNKYYNEIPIQQGIYTYGSTLEMSITFLNSSSALFYTFPYCLAGYQYYRGSCRPCIFGTIQTSFNYSGTCQEFGRSRDLALLDTFMMLRMVIL